MNIRSDDLTRGQLVTVHSGRRLECPCGCGASGQECYESIKGLPLSVLEVNLPYVAVAMVHRRMVTTIDVRDCELMAVSEEYARVFALAAGQDGQQSQQSQEGK